MALCLAASILECGAFRPKDQMDRYLRWRDEGYMSSTGRCFGIGNTVAAALRRYEQSGDPMAGLDDPRTAGSGSLMRLAPIPMYLIHDAARAKELAAEMSKTTHAATEAVDACRYLTGLIVGALRGESKEQLLSDLYSPVYNYWFYQQCALTPRIDAIARGVYKYKEASDLPATGYVVDTLEAALWAFHKTNTFRDGALLAVNLGNDADTTAAVYGQLAGAYYGLDAIPREWRDTLACGDLIEQLATQLLRQTKQGIRHFA
jgi:ADP-ribosylglycohydrolase